MSLKNKIFHVLSRCSWANFKNILAASIKIEFHLLFLSGISPPMINKHTLQNLKIPNKSLPVFDFNYDKRDIFQLL